MPSAMDSIVFPHQLPVLDAFDAICCTLGTERAVDQGLDEHEFRLRPIRRRLALAYKCVCQKCRASGQIDGDPTAGTTLAAACITGTASNGYHFTLDGELATNDNPLTVTMTHSSRTCSELRPIYISSLRTAGGTVVPSARCGWTPPAPILDYPYAHHQSPTWCGRKRDRPTNGYTFANVTKRTYDQRWVGMTNAR